MKEGQTAQFDVELSHENVPVTWYRNEIKLHPSRTIVTQVDGKKHILIMRELTLDDTCQIKAEAKGFPSMANLTVIGNNCNFLFLLCSTTLFYIGFEQHICMHCSSVHCHIGIQ